ncbi:MAG: alpha/beta hydrolase [Lentisphaeraceae bacterium]|nr:alpha/beta hydrolase [Lentisphaeraceae bacterium]
MKIFLILLCGFIITTAAGTKKHKDIEFAKIGDLSLKLDLYIPEGVKSPPLLVWVHGGGWRGGNKSKCYISSIVKHGFALASISYRLTDKAIFPAQIHDCKGAIRWLRANKDTYGYSTEKIGVSGASAGGMLAALLGTSGDVESLEGNTGGNLEHSSRVDAVVDFFGATDFVLRGQNQPSRANAPGSVCYLLFGGPTNKKTELAKLASAVTHVTKDDPPFLVIHGDKDNKVLLDQSLRIQETYKKAKLPLELMIIKNGGHGGNKYFTEDIIKKMVEFFHETLKK